jgi:hypothetical protein
MTKQEIKEKIRRAVKNDPNKEYIKSISLFGSYLHGDYKKRSDVDLLIGLKNGASLFTLVDIQFNFEKYLGRKVDLVEKSSLSKYFKDEVLAEAEKIYEKRQR